MRRTVAQVIPGEDSRPERPRGKATGLAGRNRYRHHERGEHDKDPRCSRDSPGGKGRRGYPETRSASSKSWSLSKYFGPIFTERNSNSILGSTATSFSCSRRFSTPASSKGTGTRTRTLDTRRLRFRVVATPWRYQNKTTDATSRGEVQRRV